jgi:hypothetical protein
MQFQLENIQPSNDRDQLWSAEEIRDLILLARELKETNDDLRAGIIAMQAKLNNEEAKVKKLSLLLAQFTMLNNNSQL